MKINKEYYNNLILSDKWGKYFKNYAHGNTVIEQLIHWISQVNTIITDINDLKKELIDFDNKFSTNLLEVARDIIKQMEDDGKFDDFLADILVNMSDYKIELNTNFENHKNETSEKMNDHLIETENVINDYKDLINNDFSNHINEVAAEMEKYYYKKTYLQYNNTDISELLENENENTTIYIPKGEYIISRPIVLKNKIHIEGSGDTTVLKFINSGRLYLTYRNTVENVRITSDKLYSGDDGLINIFSRYITTETSPDGVGYYKQVCNNKLLNVNFYKPFKNGDNSIAICLNGTKSTDPSISHLSGFWNFTAENVNIDGFSTAVKFYVNNGWLNANTFNNIIINNFEYAFHFSGNPDHDKRGLTDEYNKMGGNKFINVVIQPTREHVKMCLYKGKGLVNYFANDFINLDIWDIMRYNLKPTQILNFYIKSFGSNYTPENYNHQNLYIYSNILFGGRIYPFAVPDDSGALPSFHIRYYENTKTYMDIYVRDNSVVYVKSDTSMNDKFNIKRDSDGIYYLVADIIPNTSGGFYPATGTISVQETKACVILPQYFMYETSEILKTLEREVNYNAIIHSVKPLLMNGNTGEVEYYEYGNIVVVSGVVDPSNKTSGVVCGVRKPKIGTIVFENGFNISEGGFLVNTNETKKAFTLTYIKE